MLAEKIKMRDGCYNSNSLVEIDKIYISGCSKPGWFDKSIIHDYLKTNPNSIKVNRWPYPYLTPATSQYGEKYVKS